MPKAYKLPTLPKSAEYSGAKQRLNVTVRADLIERARQQGLNLSSVLEESLTERLRKSDGQRWLEENAEAIEYHKARIKKEGMWNRDLIRF